jgi:hypothetical protein
MPKIKENVWIFCEEFKYFYKMHVFRIRTSECILDIYIETFIESNIKKEKMHKKRIEEKNTGLKCTFFVMTIYNFNFLGI